jgi:hypothetical protein
MINGAACPSSNAKVLWIGSGDPQLTSIINGMSQFQVTHVDNPPSTSQSYYNTYHIVALVRASGNNAIKAWAQAGGRLITEWSAHDWIDSVNLIQGTFTRYGDCGSCNSVIPANWNAKGLAATTLSNGVSNPWTDSYGASMVAWVRVTGYNTNEVYATRTDNGAPAVLAGQVVGGTGVYVARLDDWRDNVNSPRSAVQVQQIKNMFTFVCSTQITDSDGDGTPDSSDGCPNDANKIAVGQCGCGNLDTDTDSDGTADCNDACPTDATKITGGVCGCNVPDVDSDNDSTFDCNDQCPSDGNKIAPLYCGCGELETDSDSDTIPDCVDNCVTIANTDQASTNPTSAGDACWCELADTSCDYQPDPPLVTFSDVVIGDDDLAYYRIQMNASRHWSEYVKVLFPESDNDHCDYPSGVVTWAVDIANGDPCTNMYSVDIPMNDFLGKCGFSQTIRNSDSMLFQQTVQILTNRTCEDGRINQLSLSSDVELSETRAITRETQYEVEIVAPTNATAKTGGLEVFGTAFKLDLLGDLTITPDIDTNMPTISGLFVTETQHPYELQDPVFELTGDFNYATFELTGTYCTADNSTRLACQQTWSYSFQPNQTCPDKAQLEGELVQITWNVNCSDGFIGECAPSFAVQPEATFTLNSPIYCFSSDYIELTPALEVYQFDQLTANSADFGASPLGTLTDNGFSVERVFTIDSQLYAEYTVVAAGTGVTLTATTLKKVSTTTSSRGELVLYETNAAEQVITQATTFLVHDTGFGTGESSDFADYRTRFQFTWLNDTTVLLDSTEDLAQTIALSATSISIFTNVQSLRKAGIDERHPVLSKLNSDQHSKEQEDKHMILFADGDEPRDSKTTVLARLAPASTTNSPAASTASSGFVVSPTVIGAGVALIAVVALVAFAVIRRHVKSANISSKSTRTLATSSSGVELHQLQQFATDTTQSGFGFPDDGIAVITSPATDSVSVAALQNVASMYEDMQS